MYSCQYQDRLLKGLQSLPQCLHQAHYPFQRIHYLFCLLEKVKLGEVALAFVILDLSFWLAQNHSLNSCYLFSEHEIHERYSNSHTLGTYPNMQGYHTHIPDKRMKSVV